MNNASPHSIDTASLRMEQVASIPLQSGYDQDRMARNAVALTHLAPLPPPAAPDGYRDNVGSFQSSITLTAFTDDATPGLNIGSLPDGASSATLYVDGLPAPATYDAITGTLTPDLPLPDGPHRLSYSLTRDAGKESDKSPAIWITVETTPPVTPASAPDGYKHNAGIHIGSLPSGATDALLYVDGNPVAAVYAALTGTLTPIRRLLDGVHRLAYTLTDDAGNESGRSPALMVRLDSTHAAARDEDAGDTPAADAAMPAPIPPPSLAALPASLPTASPAAPDGYRDNVGSMQSAISTMSATDDATPGINIGDLPAGATGATLYANGHPIAAIYDAFTGTLTPIVPLENGTQSLAYTLRDDSGNESDKSAEILLTVETTTLDDAPRILAFAQTDAADIQSTTDVAPQILTYAPADDTGGDSAEVLAAVAAKPALLPVTAPDGYEDNVGTIVSANSTATSTDDSTPGLHIGTPPNDATGATLYIDGIAVEATYDPNHATLTPKAPLLDGAHSLSYSLSDDAGHESDVSPAIFVTVATAAPTLRLNTIAGGELTRPAYDLPGTTPLTISGTSTGVEDGRNVSDAAGNPSLQGSAVLLVNIAAPAIFRVVQQTTDQTQPILRGHAEETLDDAASDLTLASGDTLHLVIDDLAHAADIAGSILISGTTSPAEAGRLVSLHLGDQSTVLTPVLANGTWSASVAGSALAGDGGDITYTFTDSFDDAVIGTVGTDHFTAPLGSVESVAQVGDSNVYSGTVTAGVASGHVEPSLLDNGLSDSPLIDTLAPTISVDAIAGGELTRPAYDALPTNPLDISATTDGVEDGRSVSIVLNGIQYGAVVHNNVWSTGIPAADAQALNHSNIYTAYADVTDAAGNRSNLGSASLSINIATPVVPTVVQLVSNTPTPVLHGHAEKTLDNGSTFMALEAGDQVSVFLDSDSANTYRLTVGDASEPPGLTYDMATGNWQLDLGESDALAPGLHEVAVTTDAGGVTHSDVSTRELHINTDAVMLSIDPIATDGMINAAEKAGAILLSGSSSNVETGSLVSLTLADNSTVTAAVRADGTWSVEVDGSRFDADGDQPLKADVHNQAGTAALQGTQIVRVDTLAPTLAITSDKGVLTAGETATITFTFSEEPGPTFTSNTITTTHSNGTLSDLSVTSDPKVYTAIFTPDANLAAGGASISVAAATYTDAAGNKGGADTAIDLGIDTLPPTLAITPSHTDLKAGEAATIRFHFSEEPGDSFAWDGSTGSVVVSGGTLSAISGSGTMRTASFTPTADMASGRASITVAAGSYTDAAGNRGAAGTMPSIRFDTLAPSLTITSDVDAVNTGGTAHITFSFSEDPGNTFSWDGSTGNVVVSGGTLGEITGEGLTRHAAFTPSANLASGSASITVASGTYTDAAGNRGGAGASPTILIDTLAPTLSSAAPPAIGMTHSAGSAGNSPGESIVLTLNFDSNVEGHFSGTTDNTIFKVGGTGVSATWDGLDGTSTRTLTYTIEAGQNGQATIDEMALKTTLTEGLTDAAGNHFSFTGAIANIASIQLPVIDTTAPTRTISSNVDAITAGGTATIAFQFSEDPGTSLVWDGSTGAVMVSGGTLGAIRGYGLTRTATFTPAAQLTGGIASIAVAAGTYTDAAGNYAGAANNASMLLETLPAYAAAIAPATGDGDPPGNAAISDCTWSYALFPLSDCSQTIYPPVHTDARGEGSLTLDLDISQMLDGSGVDLFGHDDTMLLGWPSQEVSITWHLEPLGGDTVDSLYPGAADWSNDAQTVNDSNTGAAAPTLDPSMLVAAPVL